MQNLEALAREYREALSVRGEDDAQIIEQIIVLEENQLDYVDAILARAQLPQTSARVANYAKNLLYRILNKLNVLLKNPSYVPSFRNPQQPCRALRSTLIQSQINIFVLYDKLSLSYADLAELLSLENRKSAVINFL